MRRILKPVLMAVVVGWLLISCNSSDPIYRISEYIRNNGQKPPEYVVSKFTDHDVVILGEHHYIKDDPLLVQELIPVLHRNGINVLATEHARAEDQYLIDSLLAGEQYDELLAKKITFLGYVHWPFREYVDIYRSAWEANRSRDEGASPFRIIGMNCSPDWSLIQVPEDRDSDSIMHAVWGGCSEKDWAKPVLDAVSSGDKVLVYCGIHHGFTRYSQPKVRDGKFLGFDRTRVGNFLYEELGNRVMTVYLHAPFTGPASYGDDLVRPADGYIDRAIMNLDCGAYPVGFDVAGSPLSEIPLSNCVYKHGYDPFTLDQFCDGYIYTRPYDEFETVTLIEDFVTEENLEYARMQTPNPSSRNFTVDEYYEEFRQDLRGLEAAWRSLSRVGE